MKNKKLTQWIAAAIIILIVCVLIFNRNETKRGAGEIKIGTALALTGFASAWGEAEQNGIKLAIDEINAKGGIGGKKISVSTEDTGTHAEKTVTAVSKLINVDGIKYIIGPTWLDSYKGAAPFAAQKDIIMITPSGSATAVQTPDRHANVFSTWYKSDKEAESLAEYLSKNEKKKVAIIMQNDSFWEDFTEYFSNKANALGLELSETKVGMDQIDFRTQLLKIKNTNPDAIVFGFSDEKSAVAFFKQKKNLLPEVPFYTSEWVGDYVVNKEYAGLFDRLTYIAPRLADPSFAAKYKSAYDVDPTFSASTAYDTVYVLAEAIRETDGSTKAVNDYLFTHEFDTVSFGKARFDELGGVIGGEFIFRTVENN